MSSTTLSVRPMPLSPVALILNALAFVKAVFQGAVPASAGASADTGDVWQLYRMTRGVDSVSPAVLSKLSKIAVSK